MEQKKKALCPIILFITFCCVFLGSCTSEYKTKNQIGIEEGNNSISGFSVEYIDVGEGDCIFIYFGDGKTMLIDSGNKSEKISERIISHIENKNVEKIDFFVLTHPDGDHVGNAVDIINRFDIGLVYIPYIVNTDKLVLYSNVLSLIKQKKIQTKISSQFEKISGEEYLLMFLSPLDPSINYSSYLDYNLTEEPTKLQINNLSPIIYLNYNGVKFIFTGDSGKSQEKIVIDTNKVGLYNKACSNEKYKVILENIDFLKVSHHGGDDANSKEFLNLLSAKNAVISVGGNNFYGHPSTETLINILQANQSCNILRTDLDGSITVEVNRYGRVLIEKGNL